MRKSFTLLRLIGLRWLTCWVQLIEGLFRVLTLGMIMPGWQMRAAAVFAEECRAADHKHFDIERSSHTTFERFGNSREPIEAVVACVIALPTFAGFLYALLCMTVVGVLTPHAVFYLVFDASIVVSAFLGTVVAVTLIGLSQFAIEAFPRPQDLVMYAFAEAGLIGIFCAFYSIIL